MFTPYACREERIVVDRHLVEKYNLSAWAEKFKLGTAGYRDLLDIENMHNPEVPFNTVTIALIASAKAELMLEAGLKSNHVGGEVRPHTQEFINLVARIYAAHGISVHLRAGDVKTTPIWLSSYGVFYHELDAGENFTASHSQNFKGGWKPMDGSGMQLLDEADQIAARVRKLQKKAAEVGYEIVLAPSDSHLIRHDFDPVDSYVAMLNQIVPGALLEVVKKAGKKGFKVAISTEGGSMAKTSRMIMDRLSISCGENKIVHYLHEEERSDFHEIGIIDGENYGIDPGKWQIYKNIGAQALLRKKEADVVFIWDADGDRFNMVTVTPVKKARAAAAIGLEIEPLDDTRALVYFKPNQIYFMLTAVKLEALAASDVLGKYNWIIATTYPTSKSIGELALRFNQRFGVHLKTYHVPVGFKHFGNMVKEVEQYLSSGGTEFILTDVLGRAHAMGSSPRVLIMAEESGGAAMGTVGFYESKNRKSRSVALKEKDGMQIGVIALALAAKLKLENKSFAEFYMDKIEENNIMYRYYNRTDVKLFDESLRGDARAAAEAAGNAHKEKMVHFYRSLTKLTPDKAHQKLKEVVDVKLPEIKAIFWGWDGTYIDFGDMWFGLRASGTDAVLRFYIEGKEQERLGTLSQGFINTRV
jgi:phosphomannomutase